MNGNLRNPSAEDSMAALDLIEKFTIGFITSIELKKEEADGKQSKSSRRED